MKIHIYCGSIVNCFHKIFPLVATMVAMKKYNNLKFFKRYPSLVSNTYYFRYRISQKMNRCSSIFYMCNICRYIEQKYGKKVEDYEFFTSFGCVIFNEIENAQIECVASFIIYSNKKLMNIHIDGKKKRNIVLQG